MRKQIGDAIESAKTLKGAEAEFIAVIDHMVEFLLDHEGLMDPKTLLSVCVRIENTISAMIGAIESGEGLHDADDLRLAKEDLAEYRRMIEAMV